MFYCSKCPGKGGAYRLCRKIKQDACKPFHSFQPSRMTYHVTNCAVLRKKAEVSKATLEHRVLLASLKTPPSSCALRGPKLALVGVSRDGERCWRAMCPTNIESGKSRISHNQRGKSRIVHNLSIFSENDSF